MSDFELSRCLYLAGTLPFLVLGTAHAFATPRAPADDKGLSPSDPQLAEAMTRSGLRLTRRTDMWRAWVGFNLSHSLGVLVFAASVILTGRSRSAFDAQAHLFLPFAVVVAAVYLRLACRYWFRTPIIGCALSLAFFLASWITRVMGPS
jgi:hypothetical protein